SAGAGCSGNDPRRKNRNDSEGNSRQVSMRFDTHSAVAHPTAMKPPPPNPSDAYTKFMKSTIMDYEKWHDGIGYDLDAFRQMTPQEQAGVVAELKAKGNRD